MGQFSVEKPVAPGSVLSGNQHACVRVSLGGWIWLECRILDKLNSYRRAGESYSDVILRLAAETPAA
jgi:hypothetical protein